jgi:small nuclear ribonucleoprotein (snRNP)-like protein
MKRNERWQPNWSKSMALPSSYFWPRRPCAKLTTAPRVDTAQKRNEEWYNLRENEKNSGVIDFCSTNFDPVAALAASDSNVSQANPSFQAAGPMLDHVDQFRTQLPSCDPLRRLPSRKRAREEEASQDDSSKRPKKLSAFASLAAQHETGPLSLLYTAFTKRQRVRVVIRYVNGIRGTLTGFLIAFDKHFNMILRDVDEVYSPRNVSLEALSNVERELKRRQSAGKSDQCHGEWHVRKRHMKQMMVRGDNVVLVYKAESERSLWPRTSKSPRESIYNKGAQHNKVPPEQRVGTPGSLLYSYDQHNRQRQAAQHSSQAGRQEEQRRNWGRKKQKRER